MHESPADQPLAESHADSHANSPTTGLGLSTGMALGIVVALVAAAGNLLAPANNSSLAWISIELGLLGIWLGLGGGPLYARLLIAGAATAWVSVAHNNWHWDSARFADVALFVAVVAIPFGFVYLFGFQVAGADKIRTNTGEDRRRRAQISLQQLFSWTLATALLASVARFASFSRQGLVDLAAMSLVFSTLNVGAVFAILTAGRGQTIATRLSLLGIAAVVLIVVAGIFFAAESALDSEISQFRTIALEHATLISIVLLMYRRLGYRLQRSETN